MRLARMTFLCVPLCLALGACALAPRPTVEMVPPKVHQLGKDVMFIPQPAELVEKMLDLANVTPEDFVIDLGSGDGRNIIAAAKRGARALGVEYNPELVDYSRRAAAAAGVAGRAQFVEGDMYLADISQASVLALFLIPVNLRELTPKFLALKPGSRIVSNSYMIPEWQPDDAFKEGGSCVYWCELFLYIVPAHAAGTWSMPQGRLRLEQRFQMLSGTLVREGRRMAIEGGRLRGDRVRFRAGGMEYNGRILGDRMEGNSGSGPWSARRA